MIENVRSIAIKSSLAEIAEGGAKCAAYSVRLEWRQARP
jgi:hypothetical protein